MLRRLNARIIEDPADLEEAQIGESIVFKEGARVERICYKEDRTICTLRQSPGRDDYGEVCLYDNTLIPVAYVGARASRLPEEGSSEAENSFFVDAANLFDVSKIDLMSGVKKCKERAAQEK